MADNVTWLTYTFQAFPTATTWNPVAGIYIFAGVSAQNRWVALYIGQATSFAERLPNHERWPEAQRLGATHIHALVVPQQADRDLIERELIQACAPRLNQHLR